MKSVVERINEFITRHKLDYTSTFLVAVSGGADSTALLLGLVELGFSDLTVCHLNHDLRGDESEADEAFVKELARANELRFLSKKVSVSEMQGSMETAAREARYSYFATLADKLDAEAVFLGHHADDQAETILFNLLRGSAGLQGMKEASELKGLKLLRPFLMTRKSEIEAFLETQKQEFRTDATNFENIAVRNRMRNEVFPILSEVMSRDVIPLINQSAAVSAMNVDCLESTLDYAAFLDPQGRLFSPKLEPAHQAVQIYVLKRYLTEQRVSQISQKLLDQCLLLIKDASTSKINLPEGRFLRRKEKRIFIS